MAETAIFGGGCFWCTEAVMKDVIGVESVESGYIGGTTQNPTYKEVCTGNTGHAEAVKVTYDADTISYAELLDMFLGTHDPTQLNRQGNDVGTQYRSGIYVENEAQATAAAASKGVYQQALSAKGLGPITSEIVEAGPFYFAEDYHQQYLAKNPGGYCGIGGTGVTCPIGTGVEA